MKRLFKTLWAIVSALKPEESLNDKVAKERQL
jgi:hypothetical protein